MKQKAYLLVNDTHQKIEVMFNPMEWALEVSVKSSGHGGNVQFDRMSRGDFTLELFFDTYEDDRKDVREQTRSIIALAAPTQGTQPRKVPSTVTFMWSGAVFCGFVKRVAQKCTMFLDDGTPVRAELSVTLQELLTPQQELAVQGLPACRRLVTVREGDRLGSIAQAALGDYTLWRVIADQNQIRNPLDFPGPRDVGRLLAVPDMHGETYEGSAIG